MKDESPHLCPECDQPMIKQIGTGIAVIVKSGGVEQHKESEHKKKVKDKERAVRMRKKAFGHDAVGDPVDKPDPRHIVKRGRTLGGQETEIDKGEFIKAAAKDNLMVEKALKAVKKSKRD